MKKLLLENLGTKVMAFVLALLLWIYLYNESTETVDRDILFAPVVRESDLAVLEFFDADHRPLSSGGRIPLRITGPKGELASALKKGIRCEPVFEPVVFGNTVGDQFTRDLTRDDLNLPENFSIQGRPDKRITVRYVKFREKSVRLLWSEKDFEGPLAAGTEARVTSVYPSEVRVKIPADKDLNEIHIKKVPIDKRDDSFVKEDWLIDDTSLGYPVIPLAKFRVDVHVDVIRTPRDFNVPLRMHGPMEVTSRLELQTDVIKVQVRGPASVVEQLSPDMLAAFVIVDLPAGQLTVGKKEILSNIHCVVLKESLASRLSVVVMPDLKPENRQVEAKVIK